MPSKPNIDDFENIAQFFELWNIDMNFNTNNGKYLHIIRQFLQIPHSVPSAKLKDCINSLDSNNKSFLINYLESFAALFQTTPAGKAFFMTDSGYMGLALNATQIGDYICIIRGFSLPVVIREHKEVTMK